MLKFEKFKEGRGISDLIKEYSLYLYNEFRNSNYDIQINFDNEGLPLIDMRVEFVLSDRFYAYYTPEFAKIENAKLYYIFIKIEIDKSDISKHKIIGLLSHELTHVNEYYNIHKRMIDTGIKIEPTYIDIRSSYKKLGIKETDYYYDFIYLLYLSLDTEMNGRISQVYQYLYDFKSIDENYLFVKLKEHKNWEYVEMLSNFDSKKFIDLCINRIGIKKLIEITNNLIKFSLDKNLNKRVKNFPNISKDNIVNLDGLYNFYEKFNLYFKYKSKYHIGRFGYIIKEVIEDLRGNRPYNEMCRSGFEDDRINRVVYERNKKIDEFFLS